MTRIFIVDDHPLMRKGIALTLDSEAGLEVCGQASSAEEALDMLEKARPDVIVVDISLPGMNGIEFVKNLKALYPELLSLVVSRHDEALYAERAIRAGARGYIMKLDAGENIVQAVRRVAAGGIHLSREINDRMLLNMAEGRRPSSESAIEQLSDRELEVFEMTGRGLSTRDISEQLHLSIKTIESYKTRIKDKLNLESSSDLMRHAVQWVSQEPTSRDGGDP